MLMQYLYSDQIIKFGNKIEAILDLSHFALISDMLSLFKYLSNYLVKTISIPNLASVSTHFKDIIE